MARKFKDTLEDEKKRVKARAEKAFERKPDAPKDEARRVLEDITAAGSNGPSYKDIKFHFATLKGLKAKCDDANKLLTDAKKRAKECGIDPAALSHLMKIEKQDPLEVKTYFKQLDRAAQACGVEMQLDFFDASGITREAQIFDDGVKAGIAAKGSDVNPHTANTAAGQTWLNGWHAGQARHIAGIGKSESRDSLGAVN